jgi:hypothetical protein
MPISPARRSAPDAARVSGVPAAGDDREVPAMAVRNEQRAALQRDSIWKWRWLGMRDSTPAFKGSLVILGLAAIAILVLSVFRG